MTGSPVIKAKIGNGRQMVRVAKNLVKSANALDDAGLITAEEYTNITGKIGTYVIEKVMKMKTKLGRT
jgi:hypothetical protein